MFPHSSQATSTPLTSSYRSHNMPSMIRHAYNKVKRLGRHGESAAHRCLANHDIFRAFAACLGAYERKATLNSLSRVCKAFYPIYTEVLWSEVNDLEMFLPVYRTAEGAFRRDFPEAGPDIEELVGRRPEFTRFANRVRSLHWEHGKFGDFTIHTLARMVGASQACLFPNLESIYWVDIGLVGLFESLLSPSLKKLVVRAGVITALFRGQEILNPVDFANSNSGLSGRVLSQQVKKLLEAARLRCPNLTSISIDSEYDMKGIILDTWLPLHSWARNELSLDDEPGGRLFQRDAYGEPQIALENLVLCQPTLTHCRMIGPVSTLCIDKLATRPVLESLELVIVGNQPPIQWHSPDPMFPGLRSLSLVLSCVDERLTEFLESLKPPHLESLAIRFVEDNPPTRTVCRLLCCAAEINETSLRKLTVKGPSVPVMDTNFSHFSLPNLRNLTVLHIIHPRLDVDDNFIRKLVIFGLDALEDLRLCRTIVNMQGERLVTRPKATWYALRGITKTYLRLHTLWMDIDFFTSPMPERPIITMNSMDPIPSSLRRWVVCETLPVDITNYKTKPWDIYKRGLVDETTAPRLVDYLLTYFPKLEKVEAIVPVRGNGCKGREDFFDKQRDFWECMNQELQKRYQTQKRSWVDNFKQLHL